MSAPRDWLRPLVVVLLAAGALLAALGPLEAPLRAPLVLGFLLVAPGLSLAPLLAGGDAAGEAVLVFAISLSLDVGVALSLLLLGLWSPVWVLIALVGLCAVGLAAQLTTTRAAPAGRSLA